ncbi:hypothetical protein AB0E08_48355 [Streptomyces sp. NPDC048281]|uniref:hypothetical protein n=1 Tax=Streptomyces sp. NPDC048281 TaxID=3154715 RepID=UPI00343D15C6
MNKRILVRVGGIVAGAGLAAAMSMSPASAATAVALHDWGAGAVSTDLYGVSACDNKADNRGIRTEYITSNGGRDLVGDANGSASGCGSESSYNGYPIVQLRVCARNASTGVDIECTSWYSTL